MIHVAKAIFVCFCVIGSLTAQTQHSTYSGYVRDSLTDEIVIGANISLNSTTGTVTNKYGFFSISVPLNTANLRVSFVGYKTNIVLLTAKQSFLQILLSTNELETVVIKNSLQTTESKIIGLTDIPIERLKAVPMAFGETDIIKALAFTPGVSVGNEGTSGLLVRGGSPDQNMILLDDAPLYNQSHLFGFVSTFNADAIKKVDLYKGAFPARFGGRLSSVIDITMKDGNNNHIKKELSIGLLSSRFMIEGPLTSRENNKTTFMLSARSSYFSLFLLPTIISYNNGNAEGYFNYWLYDINAKITHQISKNQNIALSVFRGHDYWYGWDGGRIERSKFQLDWGNTTATVKYNHVLNPKLFMNVLAAYTKYQYRTGFENYLVSNKDNQLENYFRVSSSVNDLILKTRFEYYPHNNWQVYFGAEAVLHKYQPSFTETNFTVNEALLAQANAPTNANEQSVYVENDLRFFDKLRLNIGARAVRFGVQGQAYHSFEPRLSLNLTLPRQFALKASYNQMNQFIHLLSSNTIGFPNDLWVPATKTVSPQFAEQVSVGISKDIGQQWQLSVETYRKTFKNLIDFKTGTDFLTEFDKSWETKIETNGIGQATGFEVFINKTKGKINGWLSYTYAINQRKFDNINGGQWFRANFDRRHTTALNLSYTLNKKVSMSAVWQYNTGQPATVPIAAVRNPENLYYPDLIYKDRNNFQTLDYHRLDLGINFSKTTKRGNTRTWSWGVINAYNRRNPLFMESQVKWTPDPKTQGFDRPNVGFSSQLRQISFFPVLPYLSYSLKFQ